MPKTKLYFILLTEFIAFTVYYEKLKITDENTTM